ncbi:transposase family protein [Streptomyces shenzhenensis]|uniref:transposase family protein n=1 Tax=Streptomyces shenzhenensis TaxID=943815 RepID=UPI0033E252B5
MPDPRDPRGVRHRLAVVLALTACAVLAGATSLLAVGEWIAGAPGVCAGTGRCRLRSVSAQTGPAQRNHGPVAAGPRRRRRA